MSSTPSPDKQADSGTRTRVLFPRSRKGCLTCRQRKKKCDEVRPRCAACRRLQVECVWSQEPDRFTDQQEALESSSTSEANHFEHFLQATPGGSGSSQYHEPGKDVIEYQGPGAKRPQNSVYPWVPSPSYPSRLPTASTLTPSSMTILRHYLQVTGPILASVSTAESPFMQCFLPRAHSDNVLMHALLALSGTHLAYHQHQQQRTDESSAIVGATWRHYSIVVSSLREDFAQLDLSDTEQLLRLLQILIIVCHYEALTGNTASPFFKHLRAVRQLIISLLHHPQQSTRNTPAFGVCLELYAYMVFTSTLTPHGAIDERTIPIDGFLASSEILGSYSTFGVMFIGGFELFEIIPRISMLASERLALEAAPDAGGMANLLTAYRALRDQITRWTPRPREECSALPLSEWVERGLVAEVHKNAVLVFLETAIAGSIVTDMDRIQGHVSQAMQLLDGLDAAQSATLLFWSLVVLGSCLVTPDHKAQMEEILKNSRYRMRHTYTAFCLLQKVWEDDDPRAFGPYGLSRAMHRQGWNFVCL